MSEEGKTVPAWSMALKNGGKVTLMCGPGGDRNVLIFMRDGHETTIVLSDAALYAVVTLATSRAGVPVLVDGAS